MTGVGDQPHKGFLSEQSDLDTHGFFEAAIPHLKESSGHDREPDRHEDREQAPCSN